MPDHARRAMKRRYWAKRRRADEQAAITLRADASEHFQLPYTASVSDPPSPSLEGIQIRLGLQPESEIHFELRRLEQMVAALEIKISRLEKSNARILNGRNVMRQQISKLEGATSKAVDARKALEKRVARLEVAKINAEKAFDSLCQEYGVNLQEINTAME